jgi:tetratricopeptide (TPR) repeat protein
MVRMQMTRRFCLLFCSALVLTLALPCLGEETDDYIHYHLGVKYKSENKYDQAIDEFRKLLTSYPDNYNAYMQLAEIRDAQDQPRLVIYNLKKALAYNPGWGKAEKLLGAAYEKDRQYQNAIMEYQRYQQSCDPTELDSVQAQINRLVRKVKGEPESAPDAEQVSPVASSPKGTTDTMPTKKNQSAPGKREPAAKRPSGFARQAEMQKRAVPAPAAVPQTAEEFFQQAVMLYNQGKYNEALPFLKKAVGLDRGYAAAFYYAGLIRYKLGQTDLAKVNFAKAFSYPEGAGPSHFYLGKIYGSEKNYKEAIGELNEFIETAPESDQKREAVALLSHYKELTGDRSPMPRAARMAGDSARANRAPVTEAIAPESTLVTIEMRIDSLLTMAVVDTLTDAGQAMLSGVREFQAARYDDAIREFKKVSISYPANKVAAQCIYDIGVCYMKLRLFPNAENQFDQVLERFPSHSLAAQSAFFKAYSYLERGESARAEKLMRDFIQKYRSHQWIGKAYEKLGDIYADLRQSSKAIDAYQEAAAHDAQPPDRLCALFKLGGAYMDAGNSPHSIETYKKVIELGEKSQALFRVPDSYYRIADQKYQQKDFKSALDTYQKATRKYPTFQETPWGLFQIGNIYKNTKEYQKAIDTYRTLVKTYPEDYWSKQAKWKMEDAVWENEYRGVLN